MKKKNDKNKKYNPKFLHAKNKHYTENEIHYLADEMLHWFENKNNFWLKDFAISKRLPRQRISEFCKSNEYFSFMYSLCNEIQESKLFKLGLIKKYNAALPIFALKNNCGWNDKRYIAEEFQENELKTVEDVVNLNSTMINKILKNEADLNFCSEINRLLNIQIRGIELLSIEKRIENIETKIKINLPEGFGSN